MADFVFKRGKHEGKLLSWVQENHPDYIVWLQENQPHMLKEPKAPVVKLMTDKKATSAITFNTNFWNEGPDPKSLPYLNKQKALQELKPKSAIELWIF